MIEVLQEFQEEYIHNTTNLEFVKKTHTWTNYKFDCKTVWLEHYD